MHRDVRVTSYAFDPATQPRRRLAGRGLRQIRHVYTMFVLLVFLVTMAKGQTPPPQVQPASTATSAVLSIDDQLLQTIRDAQADAAYRRDAALTLLNRGEAEPIRALMNELETSKDPSIRKAIILGLRSCKTPPANCDKLIIALAADIEPSLYHEASEIIGRSITPERLQTLHQLAKAPKTHAGTRQVAIMALGNVRSQASAKALIEVLQSSEDEATRGLAAASLSRLSGIDGNGSAPARWAAWWALVEPMTPAQWQAHLLENFTRRAQSLTNERVVLQDRLMTALRQRYRAITREEREPVLVSMLADPLDPVRELALDLIRELINTERVGPELSKALMTRLNDNKTAIRAGAALILRDLKIDEAADVVAKRLADDLEDDKSVLRAYLLVMTRQPRLAAMGPAIGLLSDIDVRAEAAGTILAGFDNQPPLIGSEQSQRIAALLRTTFATDTTVEPRFIELLGRVGNREDFQRIKGWLDHSSDAIREAAARAWVATNLTLEPLAVRAGDPVIQIIVIPAATLRGAASETMLALLQHRPENDQIEAAWGRALIAMAARVNPDAVVRADRMLAAHSELTELRMQILSAAIDKLLVRVGTLDINDFTDSDRQIFTLQLMDLLLSRSEARMVSSDSKAALTDLGRVTALKIDLSPQQQHRYTLTTIQAHIAAGELDDAFIKAGKYISANQSNDDNETLRSKIIDSLLTTADQCVSAKQHDRAGQLVSRLRARLPRPVEFNLETRMSAIELRIKLATETSQAPPSVSPIPAP